MVKLLISNLHVIRTLSLIYCLMSDPFGDEVWPEI